MLNNYISLSNDFLLEGKYDTLAALWAGFVQAVSFPPNLVTPDVSGFSTCSNFKPKALTVFPSNIALSIETSITSNNSFTIACESSISLSFAIATIDFINSFWFFFSLPYFLYYVKGEITNLQ